MAASRSNIEWRIAFLALAGSDAPNYTPAGGYGINHLVSAREREIEQAAKDHVNHRGARQPRQAFAAAIAKSHGQRQMRQAGAMGPGAAKGQKFKAAAKTAQRARRIVATSDQQALNLVQAARLQSVRQAQAGIAHLERLSFVDIRRWQG